MDSYFALIGQSLSFFLLLQLVRRKIYRQFPMFFLFALESLLSGILMLVLYKSVETAVYLKYYIYDFALSSLLQVSVLVEIIHTVLKPFLKPFPRIGWLIPVFLLLVSAVLLWPLAQFGTQLHLTLTGEIHARLQFVIAMLRILLLLMVTAGSRLLAIGWRDRELHIATGFGFYSLIYLTVTEIHNYQPIDWNNSLMIHNYHFFDQLVVLSYLASLLYWLLMFSLKEAPRKEFTGAMATLVLRLSNKSSLAGPSVTNSHKSGAE